MELADTFLQHRIKNDCEHTRNSVQKEYEVVIQKIIFGVLTNLEAISFQLQTQLTLYNTSSLTKLQAGDIISASKSIIQDHYNVLIMVLNELPNKITPFLRGRCTMLFEQLVENDEKRPIHEKLEKELVKLAEYNLFLDFHKISGHLLKLRDTKQTTALDRIIQILYIGYVFRRQKLPLEIW